MRTAYKNGAYLLIAFFWLVTPGAAVAQVTDPLPSWNHGRARQSILDFVAAVTRDGSPNFVPTAERIAIFDNDGTLWCEQPMYVNRPGFPGGCLV